MIWMKIDFYVNTDIPSKVIAFNSSKTTPLKENDLPLSQNYYYGGDGIVVKGNLLVTGNNCAIHFYQTNTNGSFTKKYNDLSTIYNNTIYTNIWINDLAIDHANNLYVVSAYEGNMMVVALPNGGKTITNAAKQYAFTVSDPVPNILATDLTYAPYGNENKYEFSFNVNTKPELAQIRFYENEADMLACNNNYAFYYQFPDGDCKQGSMSVIFDAVGGTVENKLLNDPNENGLRNLPRGEYYWNVYVKTRKSCAFAPIYTQIKVIIVGILTVNMLQWTTILTIKDLDISTSQTTIISQIKIVANTMYVHTPSEMQQAMLNKTTKTISMTIPDIPPIGK